MPRKPNKSNLSQPHKPNDWFMYQVFYIVAQSKTFFEAERLSGFSFHYISKVVYRLENALGVKLLIQGRKRIELTTIGREIFNILHAMQEASNKVRDYAIKAERGHIDAPLKMAAPFSLVSTIMRPFSKDLALDHPDLQIELEALSRYEIDQLYDYDCALFVGEISRRNFCKEYLYTSKPGLYASKEYLERKGIPETLDEIIERGDIVSSYVKRDFDKGSPDWTKPFENNYTNQSVLTKHIQFVLDDIVEGKGIGILPNSSTLAHPLQEISIEESAITKEMPVYFIYPKEHKEYQTVKDLGKSLKKITSKLR